MRSGVVYGPSGVVRAVRCGCHHLFVGDRWDVPTLGPEDEHAFWGRIAPRIESDLAKLVDPPIRVFVVADDDDPLSAHLEVRGLDRYVVPIWFEPDDGGEEAAAVAAMDLVLDSAVFEDTVDPWPVCARHPESTHSLAPALSHAEAVWECPIDRRVAAKIGMLNAPEM